MKYFQIYIDSYCAIEPLTDEDAGKLFKAMYTYLIDGEYPNLTGALCGLFGMFKAQIDRDCESYEKKCESMKALGKKGAEARWRTDSARHSKDSARHNDNGKRHFSDAVDSQEEEKEEEKKEKEKEENTVCAAVSAKPAPQEVISLVLNTGKLFPVTVDMFDRYNELFPAVDVMQELRKMAAWLEARPKNRKTANGIKAFITRWLSNAQDRAAPLQAVQNQNSKDGVSRILDMMARGDFDE